MVKSMTGFGHSEVVTEKRKITVEIRTINSKQLDLSLRLPSMYRSEEQEIRTILTNSLVRGRVDCFVSYENLTVSTQASQINKEMFKEYYEQIKETAQSVGYDLESESLVHTILRMPDVMSSKSEEIPEEELVALKQAVSEAVEKINDFRQQEGAVLISDLIQRTNVILAFLKEIETYEDERTETVKTRLAENLEKAQVTVDENRFEQEIIYYLERYDITEEKVRLAQHCGYFIETAQQDDNVGRKLGFISQEMGREINTIGSKANHTEIQKIVVQMKDELEKIKEQLLNIL